MNIYGGKELAAGFRQVRANTIRIAKDIPEERCGFRAAADTRSIGQILAHVAMGPGFPRYVPHQPDRGPDEVRPPAVAADLRRGENPPRTKAETTAFLTSEGERFASCLEGLSDEFLSESVTMPPGADPSSRSRIAALMSAKEHEMHHPGQLMLLERRIGVTPRLTRESQARMARAPQAPAQGPTR